MRLVLLLLAAAAGMAPVVESLSPIEIARSQVTAAPRLDLRQAPRSTQAAPMNPISLAQVLLTAVPQSLREIAATNLAEASRILWSDFLDGNTPSWFGALPTEIQTFLVGEFGPPTSVAASTTASGSASSGSASSTPASSTDGTSSPATTAQSESVTAAVTSFITVTAVPKETSTVESGISSSDNRVIIGLSVPLAILIIAVAILSFCLIRQCRRRRRMPKEMDHVESRALTPTFVETVGAPRRTPTLRGGTSSWPLSDEYDDGGSRFPDPRQLAAAGAAAQPRRTSHMGPGSLPAVVEEEREYRRSDGYHSPVPPPRAGGSILDNKHYFVENTVPVHPLHRNRGSFGSGEESFAIARKPLPTSVRDEYDGYDSMSPGAYAPHDYPPESHFQDSHHPPHGGGHGTFGVIGNKVSRYLGSSRPTHDRYDRV